MDAVAPGVGGSRSGVLSLTFNQDSTCIAIGSQQGIHIYNVDTHKLCYRHAIGAVSIAEMLFCTSLIAFVGAGEQPALTPRKLSVMNTTTNKVIQELTFPTSVRAVRMNRQRLVVVISRQTHIYSMQNLQLLRTIDTEDNPSGCSALTSTGDSSLLALPASATTGTLRVYDLLQDAGNVLCEVQAHQTALAILAWNHDGSLLASASAKGTVIRVHRMPQAAKAHTFRRGTYTAAIQCMAFSPPQLELQLLCVCSSHGTVHVFRLETPDKQEPAGAATIAASAAVGLLSAVMRYSVADMVEPARNIATIRLPSATGTAACAFRNSQPLDLDADTATAAGLGASACSSSSNGGTGCGSTVSSSRAVVMVATQEGLLYEYSISDLQNAQGPKCYLEGEWALLGRSNVCGS